jgi:hypothetical protein
VEYTRQEIVNILRRAGLHEAADKANDELSDRIDRDELEKWALDNGITRDMLVSQFGGSP